MELWVRSTARKNLLKISFLTVMEGKTFYKKNDWEYNGYTICNCNENGQYAILGTYKTKKRALEVLDEIQSKIKNQYIVEFNPITSSKDMQNADDVLNARYNGEFIIQPQTAKLHSVNSGVIIYEMPEE